MVTSITEFLRRYNAKRKNNSYIIGFDYKGKVYAYTSKTLIHDGLYIDNARKSLRFRMKSVMKKKLINSKNCKYVCTIAELRSHIDTSIKCYNLGECFEKVITEMHNQKWEKDFLPYYEGSDLVVGNMHYSIKFARNCTIASQASIMIKVCGKP